MSASSTPCSCVFVPEWSGESVGGDIPSPLLPGTATGPPPHIPGHTPGPLHHPPRYVGAPNAHSHRFTADSISHCFSAERSATFFNGFARTSFFTTSCPLFCHRSPSALKITSASSPPNSASSASPPRTVSSPPPALSTSSSYP